MKTFKALMAASVLSLFLGTLGCEVSHSESDKPGWFGGNKHEETTVTKNPVTGDAHVSHSETKTNP